MDTGIWRRLIVIPFKARFTGSGDIKNYAKYLQTHAGPAVMQWIMEGAQKVIQEDYRLKLPACVKRACAQYREDNDWMAHFLDECCETGEGMKEKSGELYSAYRAFAARNNEFARSTGDFYAELNLRGFERRKTCSGMIISGLRLNQDE